MQDVLDDTWRAAICDAPELQWLCRNGRATSTDLRWVSLLHELRGLSLSHASLEQADLSLFGKLQNLQWLNLSFARLPPAELSSLPTISDLEVLAPRERLHRPNRVATEGAGRQGAGVGSLGRVPACVPG